MGAPAEQDDRLTIRGLADAGSDLAAMQQLFEGTPSYFVTHTGAPARPDEAERVWEEVPPGRGREHKFIYGLFLGDRLVGCADFIRGYPNAGTAFIGLYLLADAYQGRGLGIRGHALVEERIREDCPEVRRVRLAVFVGNDRADSFWRRVGFHPTGERKPYRSGTLPGHVDLFEKAFAEVGLA